MNKLLALRVLCIWLHGIGAGMWLVRFLQYGGLFPVMWMLISLAFALCAYEKILGTMQEQMSTGRIER